MSTAASPPGKGASTSFLQGVEETHPSSIPEALDYLIQTARSSGRDMKLVSALLRSMADFLLECGADATITASTGTTVSTPGDPLKARKEADEGHPRAYMSPALRSRVQAVIDSLSDDETARALGIGARQVRRRALAGLLYYFQVGRKRRYPCWQFIGEYRVLPGLSSVARAVPRDSRPEAVQAFMTTQRSDLLLRGVPSSPVEWLVHGGDPSSVSRLLDCGW